MNPVRAALQAAEQLLENRHWVRILAYDDHVFFEAGPIHDDGKEECPTYSGTIKADGRISIGHRRI